MKHPRNSSIDAFRSRLIARAERRNVRLGGHNLHNRFADPNDNSPVYVVNMTAIYVDDERGYCATPLVLEVKAPNGDASTLVVPATWLPFCVTHEYPKQVLLNSPPFTQSVARGDLMLVEPSDAEKVLTSEEGIRESQKVQDFFRSRSDQNKTIMEERHSDASTGGSQPEKIERSHAIDPIDAMAAEASPNVVNFVARIKGNIENGDSVTPNDLIDFLEMEGPSFSMQDYSYFSYILGDFPPSLSKDSEVRKALDVVRDSRKI